MVLDLALILGASSGLYAFANLLLLLSTSSEALKALKVILESEIQVLQLIGGLGGGILIGITGAFVVSCQIIPTSSFVYFTVTVWKLSNLSK